ncbi:MAG: sulfotransferase [Pseudomonadota bacterium]|nr:sulfotransferase [Pseudomonadota bacterium]
MPPPLFILGHWRSGTTLLHNLLTRDTGQFAYANTYQAVNPRTFLSTEAVNTKLFGFLVPKTQPSHRRVEKAWKRWGEAATRQP